MKTIIGITMGDPAGVGPEILIHAMGDSSLRRLNRFVIYGDYSYILQLQRYFRKKKKNWPSQFYQIPPSAVPALRYEQQSSDVIPVADLGALRSRPLVFGANYKWTGYASGRYIEQATQDALHGHIDALVTLPINKVSFQKGGWGEKYIDHTGMLSSLTKTRKVALMLTADRMRAVHVSQHVPLKEAAALVTPRRVHETIELTFLWLKKYGVNRPRIVVCGLNPHAGDGGVLGQEEIEVIRPVIKLFQKRGCMIDGPISADVAWPLVKAGRYDAGIAMYHDQGQIPIKMMGEKIVNVTLGLPLVRTSVGHGTGYDIAGKGLASVVSFKEAIRVAARCIDRSRSRVAA